MVQQGTAAAAALAVPTAPLAPHQICNPSTKTLRELHLGNTPPGITEIELKAFLNQALEQAGLAIAGLPGDAPIVQVRVSAKFAFAEFRTVEEATLVSASKRTLAYYVWLVNLICLLLQHCRCCECRGYSLPQGMNLNGIVVKRYPLKVERPRVYNGPHAPTTTWRSFMAEKVKEHPELQGKVLGLGESDGTAAGGAPIATTAVGSVSETKTARELFIGNMPQDPPVTEATLFEVLSTALLGANLVSAKHDHLPGSTPLLSVRLAGKFAFAEFRSAEECTMATQV